MWGLYSPDWWLVLCATTWFYLLFFHPTRCGTILSVWQISRREECQPGWNFAIQLLAIPFVIHDDTKEYARKPRITVNSNCSNCSSKFTATSISTLSPILEHTGTAANLYTMTRRSVHSVFSFCSWTTTNLYTVSVQTASLPDENAVCEIVNWRCHQLSVCWRGDERLLP